MTDVNQTQEQRTELGFRDITDTFDPDDIQINDVLREVLVYRKKTSFIPGRSDLYYFASEEHEMKGVVFPSDEIAILGQNYDILIQRLEWEQRPYPHFNVYAEFYHDFYEGERIIARVSRKEKDRNPTIKLFKGTIGIIKNRGNPELYKEIKVGSIVLLEVFHLGRDNGKIYPRLKPLEMLTF